MRNLKHVYLILSVFIILAISCKKTIRNSSHITSIEGKINPRLINNKTVYFHRNTDSLGLYFCEKTITDSCELKPDGSFKFEFSNWDNSGFFDIGTKDNVFARNYFLQPGDQLNLIFEGNEMPVALNLTGRVGEYNLFLQVFSDTFYRNAPVKEMYYKTSNYMLAPDYSVYINNRRDKELTFFQNYFKGKEVDSVFKFYFENEIDYNWANDKLYFLWKKRIRKEVVPVDTSYFDFLKIIKVDNPKALICPSYVRFINLYIRELLDEQMQTNTVFNSAIERFNLAKSHLNGMGLKIAYYNFLRDEINGVDAAEDRNKHESTIQKMLEICYQSTNDSAFYHYVKSINKN